MNNSQVIIQPEGCGSREAAERLLGHRVTWNTGRRALEGEVSGAHGKSGAVRARFLTGLPGQCLGREVTITPAKKK